MLNRFDFFHKYIRHGEASCRVLDVGNLENGANFHRKLIKKYPNCQIFGLDVVDQKEAGASFAHQYRGSIEEEVFQDNFFDTIYMGEVLEHCYRPFDVLQNTHRLLRPGGRLIFDTPNPYSLSRMIRYLVKGSDNLGQPDHKIFLSRNAIERMLEKIGFALIDFRTEVNFDTYLLKFQLPPIFPFTYLGEGNLVCVEKN